jgi:hypothetical protein
MADQSKSTFLKRHIKKVILIILVIAAIGAFWAYRPAVKMFKTWRAKNLVEEAQKFADDEDWENAKRTAVASLQNEISLEALRLFANSSLKTKDARSLNALYSLFSHSEAEPADRAMALEQALIVGDSKSAARMIDDLSDEEKKVPSVRYQVVKWLLLSGQLQKAISLADQPTTVPRDPSLDLLLAQGLAGKPIKGAREIAISRLEILLSGEDRELALEALSFLRSLHDSWITQSVAEAAIKRFQGDPDLTVSHRLDLEFLKVGLTKIGREELVQKVISEYQEDHLSDLIPWLKRLGEQKHIVELTESESAKSNPDIFSIRINALERLELWELLDEEMKNPSVVIPDPLLFSARAIAAFRTDNRLRFIQDWEDAVMAAKLDLSRNWFYHLAAIAGRLKETDRQMDALTQGIQHPLGTPPDSSQLSTLFQWLVDRGETSRLLKVSEVILRREPHNPILINNHAYLKALHGKVNSDDVAQLRLLVKNYPDEEGLLDSLALVLLQNNEPQAALDVLMGISPEASGLSSTEKAIYANALFALGKEEEAFKVAKDIKWADLTKAELNLLTMTRPE